MATSKKITDERCVIEFRGVEFEISKKALKSAKVQKAMQAPDSAKDFYWALDKFCLGHYNDYLMKMPNADGVVDEEFGADEDTVVEFVQAAAQAAAKN